MKVRFRGSDYQQKGEPSVTVTAGNGKYIFDELAK